MRNTKARGKASENRTRRIRRIRLKVEGVVARPRLTVFKSNRHLICQVIDDTTGKTLCAVSSVDAVKEAKRNNVNKEIAKKIGEEIGSLAKTKGIGLVVFDRAGFPYHGLIKELAEGARAAGLNF